VGLPGGEKTLRIRLDSTPACDRPTDRRNDILPRHNLRYAYASRSKTLVLLLCDETERQMTLLFYHCHNIVIIKIYFASITFKTNNALQSQR